MTKSFFACLPRLATGLSAILLTVIPFHAFITVWLSAGSARSYTILRLWPELLLTLLVGVAAVIAVRRPEHRRRFGRDRLVWLLAAYSLVLIIWTLIGWLSGRASFVAAGQGLIQHLRLPVALLAAWFVAPLIPRVTQRLWRWLLIPAAVVVTIGLLQALVLPHDVLRHFGYGPDTIGVVETVDQKPAYIRVQSTLRGANPLGAYLVIVLAAALSLAVSARRWRYRAVCLLAAGLIVLVYTYSRSAYLGAAAALELVAWWSLPDRRLRRRFAAAGLAVVLAVGGVVFLLRDDNHVQNIFFHTDETSQSALSSNAQRSSALWNGIRDVRHEPLGRGVGTAGPASAHNTQAGGRLAENYYLQLGQETGWLGMGLFVWLTGWIFLRLWRLRRSPAARFLAASLIGLTVVNLLSHAWTDDTLAFVWWLAAGLILGASAILSTESNHKHDQKLPAPA